MSIYWLPVAGVLAVWLHEVTHAIAVRLVGGSIREIDLFELHVDFRAPTARREQVVLLAPGLVGLAALPVLLWLVSSLETALVVGFGWVLYTLAGGTEGEFQIPFLSSNI